METKLKMAFLCIATLGTMGLSSSAFAESANTALPSRPLAPPASPVFVLHEPAWTEDAPQDTLVQRDTEWVLQMEKALAGMVEVDQEFAIKTQLRTHLVNEGQQTIAEVITRTEPRLAADLEKNSLASN